MTSPRGMLAILTDGKGHVVATATDFETGSHQDAQRIRAEGMVAIAMVRAFCHPDILRAPSTRRLTRPASSCARALGTAMASSAPQWRLCPCRQRHGLSWSAWGHWPQRGGYAHEQPKGQGAGRALQSHARSALIAAEAPPPPLLKRMQP